MGSIVSIWEINVKDTSMLSFWWLSRGHRRRLVVGKIPPRKITGPNDMKPNRVREVREAARLTLQQLADRVAEQTGKVVTRAEISRIELGHRRFTVAWMQRLARALECDPAQLLNQAALSAERDEVTELAVDPAVARALASRHLALYSLDYSQVPLWLEAPATITVDLTPGIVPEPLGLVLARIRGFKVIRQWVPPNRLLTAMPGFGNTVVSVDDASADAALLGIVVPETNRS